ncbi:MULTISPECIES: hypothetical protein [Spirulina sp. CCY15215]|uniref:hypothetical protein n=1 Tax=Spirulina sp. CCY15215 TaxID=2767591 RepID=UPI00194DFB72|nr:hypothetical protein [Spirulina major]
MNKKNIVSFLIKFTLAMLTIAIAIGLRVHSSPTHDSSLLYTPTNSALTYTPISSSPNLYAAGGCPSIDCTNLAFRHIRDRHCNASCVNDNKSIFIPSYCGSEANMRKFCNAIKNSNTCVEKHQNNGRIKAVATLNGNIGTSRNNSCNLTRTGSVIYDTNGNIVVTQFPGQ